MNRKLKLDFLRVTLHRVPDYEVDRPLKPVVCKAVKNDFKGIILVSTNMKGAVLTGVG